MICTISKYETTNSPIKIKKSSQVLSIVWKAWFDFIVWISIGLQNFIDEISACCWSDPFSGMNTAFWTIGSVPAFKHQLTVRILPMKIFFLSELLFLSPKWRPIIGRSLAVVPICFKSVTSGNSSTTKSSHWWSSSRVKYSKDFQGHSRSLLVRS